MEWNDLSQASKTILERVDVNRRDLSFQIGEELEIPYFKGVITQELVDELKAFQQSELKTNEQYFKVEQTGNQVILRFITNCF